MASAHLISDEASRQGRAGHPRREAAKWSPRRTLLFVGGASLTLWLVILLVVMALVG
jgi:hypothetical protein